MRAITKLPEPNSLTQHRAQEHADYDNYADKERLRGQLVEEQRELCCYCTGRIRAAGNRMKIEHWHSQNGFPNEQLLYGNMLGACLGNEGQPLDRQHCDTRKGNQRMSRNPANREHRIESFIHYGLDGSVSSTDPDLNDEINQVLNLNLPFLKENRKAALDAFKSGLEKRGHLGDEQLDRLLNVWSGNQPGALDPFAPVIVFWLRKRQRQEPGSSTR